MMPAWYEVQIDVVVIRPTAITITNITITQCSRYHFGYKRNECLKEEKTEQWTVSIYAYNGRLNASKQGGEESGVTDLTGAAAEENIR